MRAAPALPCEFRREFCRLVRQQEPALTLPRNRAGARRATRGMVDRRCGACVQAVCAGEAKVVEAFASYPAFYISRLFREMRQLNTGRVARAG